MQVKAVKYKNYGKILKIDSYLQSKKALKGWKIWFLKFNFNVFYKEKRFYTLYRVSPQMHLGLLTLKYREVVPKKMYKKITCTE